MVPITAGPTIVPLCGGAPVRGGRERKGSK